ncbi:MAG: hypothetical protein LH702_29045 [Phormidesmis sp. CAN_BIN44]|nr:hypothetical protein [Phormidesmis sp. CAN_BIN44]
MAGDSPIERSTATATQPIIESRSQVLHLTLIALVPSARSLPCPSFLVSFDPHFGHDGTASPSARLI